MVKPRDMLWNCIQQLLLIHKSMETQDALTHTQLEAIIEKQFRKALVPQGGAPSEPSATTLPQKGYVRITDLSPHIIPVSHATLWRWVRDGKFPKAVKLSTGITAWRVEDVRVWLQEKENPPQKRGPGRPRKDPR
jgi:prophage regulatory protein